MPRSQIVCCFSFFYVDDYEPSDISVIIGARGEELTVYGTEIWAIDLVIEQWSLVVRHGNPVTESFVYLCNYGSGLYNDTERLNKL